MSLFPYDRIRPVQSDFMSDVAEAVSSHGCLIAHAPTGLGKTAAALAPALEFALANQKTVFFLTSRHTQHALAVETLKLIRQRHGVAFSVVDMLGKRHMCARDDAGSFFTRQFHDYCSHLRENDSCEFYTNFRRGEGLSQSSKRVIEVISAKPLHTEEVVSLAKGEGVCPYEAAAFASKSASVVIADYFYVFNPKIRESFLKRNSKLLEDSIIIVDEAHNLPGRMREMLTERLSTASVERAVKEAEKWSEREIASFLVELRNVMGALASGVSERLVSMEELLKPLGGYDLPVVLERMSAVADSVRESERQSFMGGVADFLSAWQNDDDGFARIVSVGAGYGGVPVVTVSFHCLDPSLEAAKVISGAYSVIMMSGTLTPSFMYRDLLGFPEGVVEREYGSPLPKENRLPLIVASATTQFKSRNDAQYRKIASVCSELLSAIPGNTAIFFPSYDFMGKIHPYLVTSKEVFKELPNLSKEEKESFLAGFKGCYLRGGVLLAVVGGSFGEGIDLPGALLNGVVIVGLPLGQPDLQTKALVGYYEQRYGRGWDYGYVFPAFTKALQCAGRCIRTETDRGVLVFLDERYAWERYYQCFPKELAPKVTSFYKEAVAEFFKK